MLLVETTVSATPGWKVILVLPCAQQARFDEPTQTRNSVIHNRATRFYATSTAAFRESSASATTSNRSTSFATATAAKTSDTIRLLHGIRNLLKHLPHNRKKDPFLREPRDTVIATSISCRPFRGTGKKSECIYGGNQIFL